MRGALLVAVLAAAAAVPAACGAGELACAAPAVRATTASGGARCVGLPERVRIRLALEDGAPAPAVARRHRLAVPAVRRIARAPGSRLLPDAGGATDLRAEPGCALDDGRPEARLSWTPAGTGLQVVVLAPELVGLRSGRFWAGPRLPAGRAEAVWRRFAGQSVHVWTVLTRERDGWRPTETASFTGPLCAVDYQP